MQVLEMAFAGNCGVSVDLPAGDAMSALFAEELGLVLEVVAEHEAAVLQAYAAAGVPCAAIGATQAGADVSIAVGGQQQIAGTTPALRDVWEATSFQLERLQVRAVLRALCWRVWRWRCCVMLPSSRGEGVPAAAHAPSLPCSDRCFLRLCVCLQAAEECVEAEAAGLAGRTAPQWRVPFTPSWTPADKLAASGARWGGMRLDPRVRQLAPARCWPGAGRRCAHGM